ncbi:MAG: DNA repair protein RadC [Bacilli bacterium]|nr:DNA repair protein RadC [Bacilli bacterium]
MRIKDLPLEERPREKALRYGIQSLSNIEVLAIVIGSGVKNSSALDIASKLISAANGLHFLENCSLEKLQSVSGMKKISSLRLAAVFELFKRVEATRLERSSEVVNAEVIFNKYKLDFIAENQEHFVLLLLSRRGMIVGERKLYRGTAEYFPLSVSEILAEVLSNKCFSFIVLHNHPSGEIKPSDDDLISTKILESEAARMKIKFVDHIIIGEKSYFSFADNNLIKMRGK